MRKKRRIRIKLIGVLILFGICMVCIIRGGAGKHKEAASRDEVYAEELAGYLTVIPLSPAETRELILPDLSGEKLTGADLPVLFEKLNLSDYYDEITKEAAPDAKKPLTRKQWASVYEAMLEKLGIRDMVTEAKLQYLGNSPGEEQIIADNGNYDCDRESCRFTYGKVYTVYLKGNYVLGIKEEIGGNGSGRGEEAADGQTGSGEGAADSTGKDAAAGQKENSGTADGQEPEESVSLPAKVRVLLTQDNRQQPFRENVRVLSKGGLEVQAGDQKQSLGAGEVLDCKKIMETWRAAALTIRPAGAKKLYLADEKGKSSSCGYRGTFQVYRNSGEMWVVNELSMEEYLYGVVPGEMPEKFAPEAQKAQAVCARTYACRQIGGERYAKYRADVNDTTDCQVYLPSAENKKARKAADETKGLILTSGGKPASTYYFSTSCGYTSGREVWNEDGKDYLKTVSLLTNFDKKCDFEEFIRDTSVTAYDSGGRYFRWTAELNLKKGSRAMKKKLNAYLKEGNASVQVYGKTGMAQSDCKGLGNCTAIRVKKRADSGTVTDLELIFSGGTAHICHENIIRTVLGETVVSVTDKNGKTAKGKQMLPSAAFAVEKGKKGTCVLYGGGFGHGIGMSQYGADGMAQAGMSCEKILQTFFPGTEVTRAEEE